MINIVEVPNHSLGGKVLTSGQLVYALCIFSEATDPQIGKLLTGIG
jgi:hypothetical protein